METYKNDLIKLGLNANQALIYELLIQNGKMRASRLASIVGKSLSRSMVYALLDELIEIGLVEKEEIEGVARFSPAHPSSLQAFVEREQKKIAVRADIASSLIPKIVSDYNLTSAKPGVRFFEGVLGVKKIYDDILATGEDLYLVRPIYESTFENTVLPITREFIKERVRKNIKVFALTPKDIVPPTAEDDQKALIDRVWMGTKDYNSPVEINIYGDKIAILSYGKELMGVAIESPQIATALRQTFILARKGAIT